MDKAKDSNIYSSLVPKINFTVASEIGELLAGWDKSILKKIVPTRGVVGVTEINTVFPSTSPEKITFSRSDRSCADTVLSDNRMKITQQNIVRIN